MPKDLQIIGGVFVEIYEHSELGFFDVVALNDWLAENDGGEAFAFSINRDNLLEIVTKIKKDETVTAEEFAHWQETVNPEKLAYPPVGVEIPEGVAGNFSGSVQHVVIDGNHRLVSYLMALISGITKTDGFPIIILPWSIMKQFRIEAKTAHEAGEYVARRIAKKLGL